MTWNGNGCLLMKSMILILGSVSLYNLDSRRTSVKISFWQSDYVKI